MNNSHISTSSNILDSWELYNLWIFSHKRRLFWATYRLIFSSQEVLGYVHKCQCIVYLQKALSWKVNEGKLWQANSLTWYVSSCRCCAPITELQNKKKESHQLWQTLPTPHIYTSNLPPTLVKTKYVIVSTKHRRTYKIIKNLYARYIIDTLSGVFIWEKSYLKLFSVAKKATDINTVNTRLETAADHVEVATTWPPIGMLFPLVVMSLTTHVPPRVPHVLIYTTFICQNIKRFY